MNLYVGSDHAGYRLKEEILAAGFIGTDLRLVDCGTFDEGSVDYPDIAFAVAERVKADSGFGILICGTGLGMSIAANKVNGIRAALCSEPLSARLAREHNDANILVLGARMIGTLLALETVKAFVSGMFTGGRHEKRIEKIASIEIMMKREE
ncbi:MAG: ribose 5-phosphate isomerase B [Syntrophomonadaceae bacterium]|jgi:ribose 5-phosphate isomerase B|nr:ribose 5-phosphate isomerase B [Syntrophomonadaceae bacterium]